MTKSIFEKLCDLKTQERLRRAELLNQLHEEFSVKFEELQNECERDIGHRFKSVGYNWCGDYEYLVCENCGKQVNKKV